METPENKPGRPREGVLPEYKGTDAALFAEHLYRLTQDAGISVDELAETLGTAPRTVYRYFTAERVPHFDDWRRIAKALGLRDVRDLLPKMPVR